MPMCVHVCASVCVCVCVQRGGPLCNFYCAVPLEPPTDSLSSHEHRFPTSSLEIIARCKRSHGRKEFLGQTVTPLAVLPFVYLFVLSLCLTQTHAQTYKYMHTQTYIHTSTHTLTHIHMGTHMQAPLFPNYLGVTFPSHWTLHYTTITRLQPSVTNIDKVIYLIYHFCPKFTHWLTVCKSTSPQHASESRVVHLLPCLFILSVYLERVVFRLRLCLQHHF